MSGQSSELGSVLDTQFEAASNPTATSEVPTRYDTVIRTIEELSLYLKELNTDRVAAKQRYGTVLLSLDPDERARVHERQEVIFARQLEQHGLPPDTTKEQFRAHLEAIWAADSIRFSKQLHRKYGRWRHFWAASNAIVNVGRRLRRGKD